MMTVSEIMTSDPITLTGNANLAQARTLMVNNRIRHIPIVEDEILIGLISQRDLLAAEESSLLTINADQRRSYETKVGVQDFMKSKLVTISEHTSVRQAALYLEKHQFGYLPVVTNGKVVGIIADSDFINLTQQLWPPNKAAKVYALL
jgi:CBS domain-containing membrane protein